MPDRGNKIKNWVIRILRENTKVLHKPKAVYFAADYGSSNFAHMLNK